MTEPGDEVAGYRLEVRIGEGGMGLVWAATQLSLDRTVALKLVRPELASDEEFRERFIAESKIAASIDDPNVVAIHDAGEDSGALFLAMAFVDGTDLRTFLREKGPLAPEDAVNVISQVAAGLEAVHRRGLVHRDVKPANVLLRSRDGEALITDFGLARVADASKVTRTGLVIGTLDYMAPEQIESKEIDGRCDVYSLGAVLFELLVGEAPFKRDSVAAQIHAHLSDPPPRPSEHDPALAPYDKAVAAAMSKDPDARPATPTALAAMAREALGGSATSTEAFRTAVTQVSPAEPATRVHRRRPGAVRRTEDQGVATTGSTEAVARSSHRRWLVGALVAIAGLAVAGLAAAVLMAGGRSDAGTTTAAGPVAEQPAETVTVEKTVQDQSGSSPSSPASPSDPADDWPGGSGYTAILASVPSKAEAEAQAGRATGDGLDAGVLYSSDYSSLRPGYWVVFSGTFPTQTEAKRRASRAQELGYADTYPRFVSR